MTELKHQLCTKDNIRFEEPLSEQIQFRVTAHEKKQIDAVSKSAYISQSELLRNLIRDHIHTYAMSLNLKIVLQISNEIDKILIERRLISSRKETNLSKMREILTDFEDTLDVFAKNFNEVQTKNEISQLENLLKLIYEVDIDISDKIDSQVKRIYRNKRFKALKVEIMR